MNVVQTLRRMLRAEQGGSDGPDLPREARVAIEAELDEELARPPRVALVGETGVGKTSTINALFGAGLPISHTRACTQIETEIEVERGGPLRVVDLPGLGEDLDADKLHMETYARVLPTADVILWVIKADNRAIANVQTALRRLSRKKTLEVRRLVIALNQVDLLQPGAWDATINQPSPEQEETIARRRDDVADKIRRAIRRVPDRQIVAYSAVRFYNLELLLEALLLACDERRRWVLNTRARCADFNSLVPSNLTALPETNP
jgi:predicted GTPase